MNTRFFYALVWTLGTAVLMLLLFFTGFQTEKLATGKYLTYLGLLIPVVVLYLGIKAARDERPGGVMTYGQGVSAGMVISVYAALMSAVYSWFHFTFVNPRFADYTLDMVREQWAERGLTVEQVEQAERITRKMLSTPVQAIFGIFFTLLIGLVLSLIIAAMLKREKPATAPAVPAATPPPA